MGEEGIFKRILKSLPGVSLVNLMHMNFKGDKDPKILEVLGHTFYAALSFAGIALYSLNTIESGELNPFKQNQAIVEQRIQRDNESQRREGARVFQSREYWKKHEELWNELFSPNGLANKNGDRVIDLSEKVDAWQRMGLIKPGEPVIEGDYKFPVPSVEDLERATESYRGE